MNEGYRVVLGFHCVFQNIICYILRKCHHGSSCLMADLGLLHGIQCFQCLLHAGFTVGAHHAFDLHCFFHGTLLLYSD